MAAFLSRSIVPDGAATYLLPRLFGLVRARRMLLFGEEISGAQAAEVGLIGEVVPGDGLLRTAEERASHLVSMPTQAVAYAKSLLARSFELDLSTVLFEERSGQGLISLLRTIGRDTWPFRRNARQSSPATEGNPLGS